MMTHDDARAEGKPGGEQEEAGTVAMARVKETHETWTSDC